MYAYMFSCSESGNMLKFKKVFYIIEMSSHVIQNQYKILEVFHTLET